MSGRLFHAPFIQYHDGFKLYAVLERSKKIAAETYPGVISYSSLDDLLEDSLIDLVVVNTPNSTHFEFAKKSLLAGKHVVVEKPFTVNSSEGAELIEISKSVNRKIAVYHNRRWDSDFRTVDKVVGSNELGKIVEAEIHFDRFSETLSYKKHKEVAIQGNGVLYDLGSHLIDAALVLFGSPRAIFGDLRIVRPGSKVDDYMDVMLYYDDLRVRLKSSYISLGRLPGFIIHGYKGSFLKSRSDVQEKDLAEGRELSDPYWGIEPEQENGFLYVIRNDMPIKEVIVSERGNYMEYYDRLFNALKFDNPLPVSADEGLEVIKIIEAAIESNQSKQVIQLN